jgi:hypothetical protein
MKFGEELGEEAHFWTNSRLAGGVNFHPVARREHDELDPWKGRDQLLQGLRELRS